MAIRNTLHTKADNSVGGKLITYTDKTGTYKLTGSKGDERTYSNVDSNAAYQSLFRNPSSGTTTYYTGASLNVTPQNPPVEEPAKNDDGNGGGNASYYDPSADLMAAYNARQAALKGNYDAALAQRRNAYETAVGDLKNQGDEALREAYINMMMNKRGLNQSLEAAGLRGGATESAMANLYNRYASDRNTIARAIAQKLAEAGNEYGNDITELGLKYNQNGADAMSDYQSQLIKARQSLANQMTTTGSNAKGTTTTPTTVSDILNNASLNDMVASDYARQSNPETNSLLALSNRLASSNVATTPAQRSQTQTQAEYEGTLLHNNRVNQLGSLRSKPQRAAAYLQELINAGVDDTELSALVKQAGYTDEELNVLANMLY